MLISVDHEFSDFCSSFTCHYILSSLEHIYAVVSSVLYDCSVYNTFWAHFYTSILTGIITLFVYKPCVFLSSQRRAGSLTQVQSQLGTHIVSPPIFKATLLLYAVFTLLPYRL